MSRYLALSDRASGPQSTGVQRRHASDLAGIGVSVLPHARARCAGADRRLCCRHGTVLITGAVRRARNRCRPPPITRAYNSIYVIDHDGSILSVYDKVHLVPFGEYLPFQDFLERLGLMQLTKVRGGFIPGDRAPRASTCRARRASCR